VAHGEQRREGWVSSRRDPVPTSDPGVGTSPRVDFERSHTPSVVDSTCAGKGYPSLPMRAVATLAFHTDGRNLNVGRGPPLAR
jgi:hypothetical protein